MGLDFSNFDLGLLTLAGAVLSYGALVLYKQYLFNTSWRKVYLFATLVSFVFSILQLLLIFQWNVALGLGDSKAFELLFAMGSFGVISFMGAIQFLPSCRMFLAMCPEVGPTHTRTYPLTVLDSRPLLILDTPSHKSPSSSTISRTTLAQGAEGASYAMLTTLSNLAGTVANSLAGSLATVWDVSNDALASHNYEGMWKLTLLCGCVQVTYYQYLPF